MKKLTCCRYLNHATTREHLIRYMDHLLRAHQRNLPNPIMLGRLINSKGFDQAYDEVRGLANRVENNYNSKRGQL